MISIPNFEIKNVVQDSYPVLKCYCYSGRAKLIVLFSAPRKGTVVFSQDDPSNPLGQFGNQWTEENFRVMAHEETVTLGN
jgi:hypothetical protein